VTTLLEHLDDLVLVLGEDLSETVGALNEIVDGGTGKATVDELVRVVNLGTKSKHLEVSLAMAMASPVSILTGTPSCWASIIVWAVSSRGGSNIESIPRRTHGSLFFW